MTAAEGQGVAVKRMNIGRPEIVTGDAALVGAHIAVQSLAKCRGQPSIELVATVKVVRRMGESDRRLRERLRDTLLDYLDMA